MVNTYLVYVNRIYKKDVNKYCTFLECLKKEEYINKINKKENKAVPIEIINSFGIRSLL